MKYSEIKEYTTKELEERIKENNALIIRLKLNHAISPLENPLKIRITRRDTAKMMTELQKRQLNNK
jgi:large subunit ribosomal protein L29